MNRGVFSRSMFNRNARNKLYNMGGLASVRKFANGGLPLGIFEEMYQKSLKAGDRTGLQNLAKNRNVSREMRDRANQASRNLLSQQIQSRANQISDSSGFNLPKGLPSLRNITNFVFPKLFANDTTQNQNTGTAQNEASTAAEALNNLTSSSVTSTGVDQNALADIEEDPKNILDNREKFTEDFESEAGATDIPFKGESSVEDEEPLVRKLPEVPLEKPKDELIKLNAKKIIEQSENQAVKDLNVEKVDTVPGSVDQDFIDKRVAEKDAVEKTISSSITNIEEGKIVANNLSEIKKQDDKAMFEDIDLSKKILDAVGATKPGDDLTLKQHYKKMEEVSKLLDLETDPDEEKRMRAFNIAMLGFEMAAGESPSALVNLGKAGASFTQREMDRAKEKKKQKTELKRFNLTNALVNDNAETQFFRELKMQDKKQEYDWKKTLKVSKDKLDIASAQIAANKANLSASLTSREAMFNAGQDLKAQIANLQSTDKNKAISLSNKLSLAGLDAKLYMFGEGQDFDKWKLNTTNALTEKLAQDTNDIRLQSAIISNYDSGTQAAITMREKTLGLSGDDIFGVRIGTDGSEISFMEDVISFSKTATKSGLQPYTEKRDRQELKRILLNNDDTMADIIAEAEKADGVESGTYNSLSPEVGKRLNLVVDNFMGIEKPKEKVSLQTTS